MPIRQNQFDASRGSLAAVFLLTALLPGVAGRAVWAAELESPTVLINLLEQADVPAREAGVLVAIDAREGARVAEGVVVARIDDTEAQFLRQRAKFEMEVAAKNAANQLPVLTAEKTRDVAQAIFQRTNEAAQKFRNTISQTELDRLRLDAEKGDLAVRQAKHELEVAQVTAQLKQNEFDFAARNIERRRIVAPLTGVVVEVFRRRGEWVEPGQKVVRIVRLDRLRAEGFMNARQARSDLIGRSVTITLDPAENLPKPFTGKITFVSPEVDPVNGQVRVLAEIENPEGTLRPGLRATMTIAARPPARR